MELSSDELERYCRQMLIPNWGVEGQRRVKESRVLVAGSGGLGSPALIYLAAAGIGTLVIVDSDRFETSNLNRQILACERDVGTAKTQVAARRLKELNSNIHVETRSLCMSKKTVDELVRGSDVVLDALDNWNTRFILNEACVRHGIPYVHAGISGFSGQVTTVVPGKGPCLRCIIQGNPRESRPFPVVGATPGLFAMVEVMEVLKIIVGIGETLVGKILVFNGIDMSFSKFDVFRNPLCPVCGEKR